MFIYELGYLKSRRFMNKLHIQSYLKRADVNFVVLLCRWCLPLNVLFSSFVLPLIDMEVSSCEMIFKVVFYIPCTHSVFESCSCVEVPVMTLSLIVFISLSSRSLESRCHDTCLDVCLCVFTIGLMCWGTIWSKRIFRKPKRRNCCSAKTWGQGNNDRQIQGRFYLQFSK